MINLYVSKLNTIPRKACQKPIVSLANVLSVELIRSRNIDILLYNHAKQNGMTRIYKECEVNKMTKYKLSKKEGIIVHSFTSLYDEMYAKLREKLESMSIADLQDTINAFENVSDTNCSWTAYQLKNVILADAKWILDDKKRSKERISDVKSNC